MVDYQGLTYDELLHLVEQKGQLTDEARVALEAELGRRRVSSSDVEGYKSETVAADKADDLQRARPQIVLHLGLGKVFFGKANRRPDRRGHGRFELCESTLWFVVLGFPVYPIATYTVRRLIEKSFGIKTTSFKATLERHPRNWEQILLTWVEAMAILLGIFVGIPWLLKYL